MYRIGIIGYGYVGKALANRLAKIYPVICYDYDASKVKHHTEQSLLTLTNDSEKLKDCNVYIVTVQTPLNRYNEPDLSYLINSTRTIAQYLLYGDTIIYESTVYPGVTEEICVKLLEKITGLTLNADFYVAYSPERICPGDVEHPIEEISKVVSGANQTAVQIATDIYSKVTNKKIYVASGIKEAEAVKVLENLQRDVNIALINEFSLVMKKMDIDVFNVLEGAKTKWNFNYYTPGLVGGHCIGIDTHYFINIAREKGIEPFLSLEARKINEKVILNVAKIVASVAKEYEQARICIVGITYKNNCDDIRNSAGLKIASYLKEQEHELLLFDPIAKKERIKEEGFDLCKFEDINNIDIMICLVYHDVFDCYAFSESMFRNKNRISVIDLYGKIKSLSKYNKFSF